VSYFQEEILKKETLVRWAHVAAQSRVRDEVCYSLAN
jgi:hypothetical protein